MQIPNNLSESDELKQKRTSTAKVYTLDSKRKVANCSTGVQHYNNKLKLGDGNSDYPRELDFSLKQNDSGIYTFEYNNFIPQIPEYADEWIVFRDVYADKDQDTKFKPICSHVKGILKDNGVIYPDAFGSGIDLIVRILRTGLQKLVRVRNPGKEPNDMQFKFEVSFPDRVKFSSVEQTDKDTLIRPYCGWINEFADKKSIPIDVDISNGILTKTLPKKFIEASGDADIYLDVTTSYSSSAGDGYARQRDTTTDWATSRDAVNGTTTHWNGDTIAWVGTSLAADAKFDIRRGFNSMDTSAIGAGNVVSAATVGLDGYTTVTNGDNDGADYIAVVQASQASTSELVVADYNNVTFVAKSNTIDIGSWDNAGLNSFVLTDLSLVVIDGWSKIGVLEGHDITDAPYAGANNTSNRIAYYTNEEVVRTPAYVSVTYAAASTGAIKNVGSTNTLNSNAQHWIK